jgi:DNA-binding NarL/FixJ family response regulator
VSQKRSTLFENLTTHERRICECLAKGMSNKEIAEEMGISSGTVKVHIHNIIGKTGLYNRTKIALKWAEGSEAKR